MSDSGARRPAARAMPPHLPHNPTEGAVSAPRLVRPTTEQMPESVHRSADGDWASFSTAPTLLLTQPRPVDGENASPSAAVTPPAALEEQPWFRSGTTLPPPSMRPPAESVAPPPVRNPPNPRVVKIVGGVIAACLLIVAIAGVKVLYLRIRGPVAAPEPTAQPMAPVPHAMMAEPAGATPTASQRTRSDEPAPPATAPSSAQPSAAIPVTRSALTRSIPAPARTTTKPATRRAPATKKVGRSH
jgi:hypothetical protein